MNINGKNINCLHHLVVSDKKYTQAQTTIKKDTFKKAKKSQVMLKEVRIRMLSCGT